MAIDFWRNVGEYLSGQEGWIPGRDTKGKVQQQLSGKDVDWHPGISKTGGDRSPSGPTVFGVGNQAPAQAKSGGSFGGGGGGGNNAPVYQEQYYQQSAQAAPQTFTDRNGRVWNSQSEYQRNLDNVRRNVGVKQSGYISEAESARRGAKNAYDNDAQAVVNEIRSAQAGINTGRANNALNVRRSMASIASGIRQGLRSGQTELANMNAGDSSAARAMAMGFARSGNKQASQVNNEAQLKEGEFDSAQQELNRTETQKLGTLKRWRDNKVKDISAKLYQSLAELDAQAQGEGLDGGIDWAAHSRVVSQANAELNAVDAATRTELGKINPLNRGQVEAQAAKMDAAGAAVGNPFSFDETNVGFGQAGSEGGAPISPVPTAPGYRDEDGLIAAPNQFQQAEEEQLVV